MKRKDLATALGVSAGMVTRHAQAGMPTDSVAAARAWRTATLNPIMTKGNRVGDSDLTAAQAIARVDSLWPVARAALTAGRFDLVEAEMRAALREVPHDARGQISVDFAVMDQLTQHVADAIDVTEGCVDGAAVTDAERESLGAFWYSVAADEAPTFEGLL